MSDAPQRRIQIKLDLGADSWKEVAQSLGEIQHRVYEQEDKAPNDPISCTSGGCGSGWHLEAKVNMEQTAEGYRRDLTAYLNARRAKEPKP